MKDLTLIALFFLCLILFFAYMGSRPPRLLNMKEPCDAGNAVVTPETHIYECTTGVWIKTAE